MTTMRLAIHREAALAAEHLASGATCLGNASYVQQAYYYQAFFALSVGFERSAKLALAIDHRLRTGSYPSEPGLRNFGHKLDKLMMRLGGIAEQRCASDEWGVWPATPIHEAIIDSLSDFASNVTRYYNLDLITESPRLAPVNPLLAWHQSVFLPTAAAHYSDKRRAKDEATATAISEMVGEHASVYFSTETDNVLTDVAATASASAITAATQPWVRMYVLQIARFVAVVLSSLGRAALQQSCEEIPYLQDYYQCFLNDDSTFRRRKIWSIYRM